MKSPIEMKYDKTADRYMDQFGQPYVIVMCDPRSAEEHIAAMENAMKKGTPVPDPSPDSDESYDI